MNPTMNFSPRRSSMSAVMTKFETGRLDESKPELHSMSPSNQDKPKSIHRPRNQGRRSSLAARLSLFESMIAENSRHSMKEQKKTLDNRNGTTSNHRDHPPYPHTPWTPASGRKTTIDGMPTPTSVTSTETMAVPDDTDYLTMTSFQSAENSIPKSLCVPFCDHSESGLGSLLDGDEDGVVREFAKAEEARERSPSATSITTLSDEIITTTDNITFELEATNHSEDNNNGNNSSSDDADDEASLSDTYDSAKMLVDWDYQVVAMRHRAAKERKAVVDTGSRLSLKDRMKAFTAMSA